MNHRHAGFESAASPPGTRHLWVCSADVDPLCRVPGSCVEQALGQLVIGLDARCVAAELDHLSKRNGASFPPPRHVRRERRLESPGRDAFDLLQSDGTRKRREQRCRIAVLPRILVESGTTGLMAWTAWPAPRMCRINAAVTKVLPMLVPVAVTKTALIARGSRWRRRAQQCACARSWRAAQSHRRDAAR